MVPGQLCLELVGISHQFLLQTVPSNSCHTSIPPVPTTGSSGQQLSYDFALKWWVYPTSSYSRQFLPTAVIPVSHQFLLQTVPSNSCHTSFPPVPTTGSPADGFQIVSSIVQPSDSPCWCELSSVQPSDSPCWCELSIVQVRILGSKFPRTHPAG